MKIILNLIIAYLIYLIYLDVNYNAEIKEPDYLLSCMSLSALFIFGFIRYYYAEFKELLMTKK